MLLNDHYGGGHGASDLHACTRKAYVAYTHMHVCMHGWTHCGLARTLSRRHTYHGDGHVVTVTAADTVVDSVALSPDDGCGCLRQETAPSKGSVWVREREQQTREAVSQGESE